MKAWLAVFLGLLTAPFAAQAHPHVLVDTHLIAQFEQGKIVSLLVGWRFDPLFSHTLIKDFDQDRDGKLSDKEIAKLEKEAFRDTRTAGYFTYARIDGKDITWPEARDFKLLTQADRLVYSFRLILPTPLDPRQKRLTVTTYEETYYIDMDLANDAAVAVNGPGSEGCQAHVSEDRDHALLGGLVVPKMMEVRCD